MSVLDAGNGRDDLDPFETREGPARETLLARGRDHFAEEPRRYVVAEPPSAQGSAMVVSTRVRPGRDGEYRAWQDSINAEAARHPGYLGSEVIPPVAGLQEKWVTLLRFDSPEHLRNWLSSDVRTRLVDEASGLWARPASRGSADPSPGVDAGCEPAPSASG